MDANFAKTIEKNNYLTKNQFSVKKNQKMKTLLTLGE